MGSRQNEKGNNTSIKAGLKEGYRRTTFIIKDDIAYKLNCISSYEDEFLNTIVNEVLEAYITRWEKRNHEIIMKKNR